MYTRTFSALLIGLTLTACDGASPKDEAKLPAATSFAEAEASATKAAADNGLISRAVSGASVFAARCEVETAQTKEGLILTLRHPDGGFRRLLVVKDGLDAHEAACAAARLHNRAALLAGPALIADDLCQQLPEALAAAS